MQSSFSVFPFAFSMFSARGDSHSEWIESFLSDWISTKSRFLSDLEHRSELQRFSGNTVSMVDEQLLPFYLPECTSNRSNIDPHHDEWIVHSSSDVALWCLWVEIDRHDEYFIKFKNESIHLRQNHCRGNHGQSRSIGNVDDHSRIWTGSEIESRPLFSRSRWKSIQCFGLDLPILLSDLWSLEFPQQPRLFNSSGWLSCRSSQSFVSEQSFW